MQKSAEPPVVGGAKRTAEIVDLLLTVGYIDGQFHQREQAFVKRYLDSVLVLVEQGGDGSADERRRLRDAYELRFDTVYGKLDAELAKLNAEVLASNEGGFVPTRLKVRAVTLFRSFSPAEQTTALELVRALMHADGVISQPEQRLYDELLGYFTAPAPPAARAVTLPDMTAPHIAAPARPQLARPLQVMPAQLLHLKGLSHPLLDPLEQTYSPHPRELQAQIARDYQLVEQSIAAWNRLRVGGNGRLANVADVGQLPVGARFLDQHVHVLRPDRPLELVVLGDLHGCYGCLKAALLQSDFVNRVWAHQWDPVNHPDVKLVLLGDYIDRGRFSFDGVLRAVLQLFLALPDHVIVLRGNHEYFLTHEGRIYSGVHPAEALASITPYVPFEMLEAYRVLFENMPTSCLVDRTFFVHGGVPRDDTFAERYHNLASLNDRDLRFQMLWSDPEQTDHIPVDLQRQNSRFSFGRNQFRAFMERLGCNTMIRGHEKIDRGFDTVYDLGSQLLLNLFSAGGHDNNDLPVDASYRSVTPMALTIYHHPDGSRAVPWPIHYQPFNYDVHNGLHRRAPLLEHRYY